MPRGISATRDVLTESGSIMSPGGMSLSHLANSPRFGGYTWWVAGCSQRLRSHGPCKLRLLRRDCVLLDPSSRPEGATRHLRKQAAAEVANGVHVQPDPFNTAQCDSADRQRPRHVESRARLQHRVGRVARRGRIKTRQTCRAVGR